MTATRYSLAPARIGTPKPAFLDGFARQMVISRLRRLRHGRLLLRDGKEQHEFGVASEVLAVRSTVTVHDRRFYSELAFGGSIGAAEAYMLGYWTCDDLTGLVRIFARNQHLLQTLEGGTARLTAPLQKLFHWLNRNSQRGSQRNIAAHYDLGNDLFALFLDERMMYSCAFFEREDVTLEEASTAKLERICRKLRLRADDHVLEIGTGWGGFAIYAASHHGCRVTTTTISEQQYRFAVARVARAGLAERVTVLLKDYRELHGQYDKLVSIEMIEAVGHQYYDAYFRRCSELIKPDGMMLLQAITIADQRYEQAKREVDFIQRYVFPGSCIPSVAAITGAVAQATDMRLLQHEDIGLHYAITLRHWRQRFFANIDRVRAQGYSEVFIRLWEFYLCYCEGGFSEGVISDVHMLFVKPLCRDMPERGLSLSYAEQAA